MRFFVSIHAPAWGATRRSPSALRHRTGFNPRARVGRDMWPGTSLRCSGGFNPRARVGRDSSLMAALGAGGCFNPRARVGRDVMTRMHHLIPMSFNPRARVGRDGEAAALLPELLGFNPRARVGRDTCSSPTVPMMCWFQSTRPRGARLSPSWTNTNYSTKQSYIQAATKLTKITRPAVPQFCCQGTRANIVINQHHLPFARHRARQLAKPQGHKVSSHQNAPPFFANSSRGYIRAGYLLTHQ